MDFPGRTKSLLLALDVPVFLLHQRMQETGVPCPDFVEEPRRRYGVDELRAEWGGNSHFGVQNQKDSMRFDSYVVGYIEPNQNYFGLSENGRYILMVGNAGVSHEIFCT